MSTTTTLTLHLMDVLYWDKQPSFVFFFPIQEVSLLLVDTRRMIKSHGVFKPARNTFGGTMKQPLVQTTIRTNHHVRIHKFYKPTFVQTTTCTNQRSYNIMPVLPMLAVLAGNTTSHA